MNCKQQYYSPENLLLLAIFGAHALSQAAPIKRRQVTQRGIEDYPDMLNIQDVQEILRIGKSLCYKVVKAIPHIKVGKSYRVSKKYLIKKYFSEVD